MRDVQSSECEPHGSIVLVDISSSRFLVIQREETKKMVLIAARSSDLGKVEESNGRKMKREDDRGL